MLFTPIVLMTVMGIIVNVLCQHQIPPILKNLCGVMVLMDLINGSNLQSKRFSNTTFIKLIGSECSL